MSFLSRLSTLRKSSHVNEGKQQTKSSKPAEHQEYTLLPQSYVREEDPAVKRLKELRRQELLKKGELSKKFSSTSNSKKRNKKEDDGSGTETKFKKKLKRTVADRLSDLAKKKVEPIKKLTFDELMKQAESNSRQPSPIEKDLPKESNGQQGKNRYPKKIGFKNSGAIERSKKPLPHTTEKTSMRLKPQVEVVPTVRIKPPKSGFAQPNQRIKQKLESRKQSMMVDKEDEYESEMGDFIEDDEFESSEKATSQRDSGYDRDEIWAMFNRGKRRSDYAFDDYEDDNMEANEMEILEEEEQARKMARLEDKREEEWLKRHEQEKKRRKRMKD